jgi:hypothetical protein
MVMISRGAGLEEEEEEEEEAKDTAPSEACVWWCVKPKCDGLMK